MTAENLYDFVMNDKNLHDSIAHNVRMMRLLMDRAATKLAAENARVNDDPDAEDYKENHAPHEIQFPQAARDEAVMDLVKYFMTEIPHQP